MNKLFLDTETYSEVDIKKAGAYRYALDPSTEVLILTWALNDGEVVTEDLTANGGVPSAAFRGLFAADDTLLLAHNAAFDRYVLACTLGLVAPIERWYDTAAQARAHGYPGALDELSRALLGERERKNTDGKRLIRMFCSPQPRSGKRLTAAERPEEWERFLAYAAQDIVAMRAAHALLPEVNYSGRERELWYVDQRINDRGFAVDVEFAQKAQEACEDAQAALAMSVFDSTSGAVDTASQTQAMRHYLIDTFGLELDDLRADTVRRVLADPTTPDGAARILTLRQEAARTSTAKFAALLAAVCPDGRVHGTQMFCGAPRTGRWSGAGFQPHNMPRPAHGMSQSEIELAIEATKDGTLGLLFDRPLAALSSALRGCIVAQPGRKLVVADLSAIEGRTLPWLAGEQWELDAYRAYDAGTGPDIYRKTYAEAFTVPIDSVTDEKRQQGKVLVLAAGYQSFVGGFVQMAQNYDMDLSELAASVMQSTEPHEWADGMRMARSAAAKGLTHDLELHVYAACAILVTKWRAAHPRTVAFWRALQDAFEMAVCTPGETFSAGRLRVRGALRNGRQVVDIVLPSGRVLMYDSPQIEGKQLTYMGVGIGGKWMKTWTYGGSLAENVTQAVARDVLADAMLRLDADGHEIVLTVHDEIVVETPLDGLDGERLVQYMTTAPAWAPDLPLAAKAFETLRYRKG